MQGLLCTDRRHEAERAGRDNSTSSLLSPLSLSFFAQRLQRPVTGDDSPFSVKMPLSSVSTSSMTSLSASSDGQRRSGSAKLPLTSIPDMRFEQSYLASVRAFIHEVEKQDAQQIKESRQDAKEERSSASRHENTSDDDPIVSDVLDAGVQSTTKRRRRTASQSSSPPHIMTSTSLQGEPELWLGRLRIEWWVALFSLTRLD